MSLFLKAPLSLAPRMIVPRLYSLCFRSRSFKEVPAVDLVAWPDTVLVLDHGSSIFIWIGGLLGLSKRCLDAAVCVLYEPCAARRVEAACVMLSCMLCLDVPGSLHA